MSHHGSLPLVQSVTRAVATTEIFVPSPYEGLWILGAATVDTNEFATLNEAAMQSLASAMLNAHTQLLDHLYPGQEPKGAEIEVEEEAFDFEEDEAVNPDWTRSASEVISVLVGRAKNGAAKASWTDELTLGDLAKMSHEELTGLSGIGDTSAFAIEEFLAEVSWGRA